MSASAHFAGQIGECFVQIVCFSLKLFNDNEKGKSSFNLVDDDATGKIAFKYLSRVANHHSERMTTV